MCFLFMRFGGLFYEENEDVLSDGRTSAIALAGAIIHRPQPPRVILPRNCM